jgi:hypothetical protein
LVGQQDLVLLILEQVKSLDVFHDQASGEPRAESLVKMREHVVAPQLEQTILLAVQMFYLLARRILIYPYHLQRITGIRFQVDRGVRFN